MHNQPLYNQTLALAASLEYCQQVFHIATTGHCNLITLDQAVYSVLQLEAQSIDDIYGNTQTFQSGMKIVQQQLGGSSQGHNIELTRYLTTLLSLESSLMKNSRALSELRTGIENAKSQAQYFDNTHDNVLSNLADIYKNIISPLGSKVIVNGEQRFLADEDKAKKIRVFLLAALRSIVLWRQSGGRKLKLIFQRGRYIDVAKHYLDEYK